MATTAVNLGNQIRSRTTSVLSGLWEQYKLIRPVYKIMITTPNWKGNNIVLRRHILADTSRPNISFMGKGDSPVLGIWVDQSDVAEPDKCIVLLQNPIRHESGIFEQDIIDFPQFGVRNWLDIWLGYSPVLPGNSILNLGQVSDQLGSLISRTGLLNKIPFTYPDPFFFGNESHVFSGPIVSSKRQMTSSGDRIQLVGFSPIIILRHMKARDFKLPSKKMTLEDLIKITVNDHIKTYGRLSSYYNGAVPGRENSDNNFYMGMFTDKMFKGKESAFRVSPISNVESDQNNMFQTRAYRDADKVGDKMRSKQNVLDISAKLTLYDLLFKEITDPLKNGGLVGLYAFIRPAFSRATELLQSFSDGEGHPGVFVKYGFKFETQDIAKQIENGAYDRIIRQEITLGRNAMELDAGIEYGSVFNTREFMISDSEERGGAKFINVPLDQDFLTHLSQGQRKSDEFWNSILDDISIFGETAYPGQKWLYGQLTQAIDIQADQLSSPIKNFMRSSYFTGMGGSIFSVGNVSIKPGRLLKIKDQRNTLATKLEDRIMNKAKKLIRFAPTPASPPPLRMSNPTEKDFYVWKVRHYLGIGSGLVTKAYFVEERNRSWQQYTQSVDSLIRAALSQQKGALGMNV